MKVRLLSIFLLTLTGCKTSSKIFVLDDIGENKYYLSDSIKIFQDKYKSLFIAIDGIEFKYQKSLDTIKLPLKKSDIASFIFLQKQSSILIYGEDANKGAIVINTKASQNESADTVRIKNEY